MTSEYKNRKAKLVKEAIAETRSELEQLETALEIAEVANYDDRENPAEARENELRNLNQEIRDKLDELATLYEDLAATY